MTTWMWVLAITLLALVVLGVVITVAISLNTKPSSGGKNNFLSTVREKSTVYAVMVFKSFVAVVLIHVIIYLISDKWWTDHILNIEVAILQVVMVIAFWVIPASIFKTERVLAYFMSGLLGVAFVWVVFFKDHAVDTSDSRSLLEKLKGQISKPSPTSVPGQSVYVTTEQGIIPPGTLKYPREGTFENKGVAERVLAGQWDLLAACFRESGGMKQFNSAGKVLTYENRDKETKKVTSIDRGACMINSQHDARIPNHPDADTLVGNLEFAKILYNEGKYPNQRGLKPWTPHLTKEEFVFEVPVEADGTETNTFIFPYEDITKYSFHPSVATTITVIDLDKVEHTLDIYPITERDPISGGPVADKIRMYRFKAKDGKASVVTVTYRYK